MQAVSDEQLIRWVAEGDNSCLGTLFERHHRGVYRFCLQMLGNRAVSEDVVQETFMRVMNSAASFKGAGSYKAWMYTIARNVVRDHQRRAQREVGTEAQEDALPPPLVDGRSAERAAAGSESLQRLLAAMAELPESAREIIWLGRFEFDSYAELGAAMNCAEGTARVRLHRAMKKLNEILIYSHGAPIDAETT